MLYSKTLKRQEIVICPYLLHMYDVIFILKLHKELSFASFFCSYTVWEFEWSPTYATTDHALLTTSSIDREC